RGHRTPPLNVGRQRSTKRYAHSPTRGTPAGRRHRFGMNVAAVPRRIRRRGPWSGRVSLRVSVRLRADAKSGLIRILRDLQVAQLFPAAILTALFRSRVFITLKPEAKPLDIAGLGGQALNRISHHVAASV